MSLLHLLELHVAHLVIGPTYHKHEKKKTGEPTYQLDLAESKRVPQFWVTLDVNVLMTR